MAKAKADPPLVLTPKERTYWRQATALIASVVSLMQLNQDPGVASMASEIQQIMMDSRDRIIQAYRDAKSQGKAMAVSPAATRAKFIAGLKKFHTALQAFSA